MATLINPSPTGPPSTTTAANALYYRKLCAHSQIPQSSILLPEASSSLDDDGVWRNSGVHPLAMRTVFLDFQSLHHLNVVQLQDRLVKECNEIIRNKTTTADQLEHIQVLLRDHSEAIRNWDAMLVRPVAPNRFADDETERAGMFYRYLTPWDNPVTSRVSARLQRILRRKKVQDLWQRFTMALLGGIALIVPMVVMNLRPNQTKSLVTTCVAVLIFSITIAVVSKATPENVLGVTAAYAAVLVVFVGAGSGASQF